MSLRYPLSILTAYCVFLLLLRFWLGLHRRRDSGIGPDIDPPDLDFTPDESPIAGETFEFGGGEDFAGAGAGGSWGERVSSGSSSPSSEGSLWDGLGLDLEEGWLVVIAILALIGGLLAMFYIVYIAPALLAEILVDGALLAGLYRRMKRIERRHWLRAAVRRTVLPALLVVIFFTVAGYALQRAVPDAHSMGDVWNHMMRR